MKHTATNDQDHNLEFLTTLSHHVKRDDTDPADRHAKVKRVVESLNEFYAEHGRMPSQSELPAIVGTDDETGDVELTYELDE
jgi:hypothetical protein